MKRFLTTLCLALTFTCSAHALTHVVAAENVYGNIAKTIGGKDIEVTSIMNNPNQDPHLFSADPKTVKLIANLNSSDIVIVNGADYDPWAINLLHHTKAQIINVAKINNVKEGANPHLWYNLNYVENFAKDFTDKLNTAQPEDKLIFEKNLKTFIDGINKLNKRIDHMKDTYPNLPVTATEPVAGYLATALGLDMRNKHFQLSIMNDTQPSAKDRAAMIDDLTQHKVVLLIYNQQVTDPTTDSLRALAQKQNIPIVGVTELLPLEASYLTWYDNTLNRINQALTKKIKI